MNSQTAPPGSIARPTSPAGHFEMRFSSTPRGARLARRLAGQRLDAWGIPYDCDTHHALTLIVGELTANAVRHGRVPGRDFHLSLTRDATTVRIEVTDTRTEGVPVVAAPTDLPDTGRGLLLVEHLADHWDWHPRQGGPGKTVWAEYVLPAPGWPTAAPRLDMPTEAGCRGQHRAGGLRSMSGNIQSATRRSSGHVVRDDALEVGEPPA